MNGERASLLPSAAAASSAARPHGRVLALAGTAAVVLATLVAVSLNAATNFSPASTASAAASTPTVLFPADKHGQRALLPLCEEKFITQPLDQFVAGGEDTYEQRYFICGRQFFNADNGTIFFYTGNEGDVLLFLNNTGLMWENAEEFNALLVFAEHRYFGKSIPFGDDVLSHMEFLQSTQALADYAVLVTSIKRELDADVPVIGFGGSYGGMLAAWFRLKYPHLMDGAIAASAPVLHSATDPAHPLDSEAFQRTVVFDMTEAAGSSANCTTNMRKAIDALGRLGETPDGRAATGEVLRLCDPSSIQSPQHVQALVTAVVGVFGNLAMGNYPYPSSYIMKGLVDLPAYPMRAACEFLAPDFGDDDLAVLAGLRDAVGVYYNATHDKPCLFPSGGNRTVEDIDNGNYWGYLACAELYMPLGDSGLNGVFPAIPSSEAHDDADCVAMWGVHIRPHWVVTQYGGLRGLELATNIVFSNGDFDPFSGTGVLRDLSASVVAVAIDGGAHHVDLFFSHALDTPAITQARETEKRHMRQWVREFYGRKRK